MKKFVLFLLIFMTATVWGSYMARPTVVLKNDGAVIQMKNVAPPSSFSKYIPITSITAMTISESAPLRMEDIAVEQSYHSDDIPLTYEEQDCLLAACEEFNVPYALVLGLIEKETRFQDLVGDDGASTGYMQIQQKWHWDRMERLGVTDLLEPSGNFRVGCDFLAELYAKYNDWNMALTVYNMGHDPGYITDYAKDVIGNYARWQEIIDNYI